MSADAEDAVCNDCEDTDEFDAKSEERLLQGSLRWEQEQQWERWEREQEQESEQPEPEEQQQESEQEAQTEEDGRAEEEFEDRLGDEPDHAIPTRAEINKERRRMRAVSIARQEENEAEAAEFADEWFGISGEAFDPSTPEPVPFVLEYGVDDDGVVLYAFPEGVSFLFGTRSSLKTWLIYFTQLQELRKGNWILIIDYELSYEEAMRRFHTLADASEEPLTADQLRRLIYINPSGPPSDAGRKKLLSRFKGNAPTVVAIDSVGMGLGLSGLDENVSKDVIVWGKELVFWLKKEWSHTAIILIDHVPKAKPGAPEATDPIGTQRKGALASGLYFIASISTISRKTRGKGRLKLRKSRQGHGDENVPLLDFEFGGGGPSQWVQLISPASLWI